MMSRRLATSSASLILVSAMSTVIAGHDCGPLVPPRDTFRGLSFEEWNFLWSQRVIEVNLAGSTKIPETPRNVRLLPSVVSPGVYEFDVVVNRGTGLVAAPFFVYGEHYDNPEAPDDTPQLIEDLQLFDTVDIQVILDGRVLLDGTGTELHRWRFDPTYFHPPITYAQPQYRFDDENGQPVNAVQALFVEGIGTVYNPLPPGSHTLIQHVSSPFFGEFHYVYRIKVSH
jgi:hypothetical protein